MKISKPTIIILFFLIAILLTSTVWYVLRNPIINNSQVSDNFIFAVEADPHMDENSDGNLFKDTINQINISGASFLIDLGDTFMTDKLDQKTNINIQNRFILMRRYFDFLKPTLYLVKGNHDGEAGWDSESLRDSSISYRLQYFPSSNDKTYYSFVSGNALFIILDPYLDTETKPNENEWLWTLGKNQYDWLKSTLENSTSEHKFVFIHQLVGGDNQGRGGTEYAKYYEWGGYNKNGTYGFDANRPGWGKPIHQLLVDHGVEIVFKGHDHIYVRQELDGIIYQTVPQPSHPGDNSNNATTYGYVNGDVYGTSGFLKIIIGAKQIRVEYIRYDGTIISLYTTE